MKKITLIRLLFFTLLFWGGNGAFAQKQWQATVNSMQQRIDSLQQLLPTQKEDTNKVRLLRRIGASYKGIGTYPSLKKALEYFNRGLELSQKLNYKWGIVFNSDGIGDTYYRLCNYPEAEKYYLISLSAAQAWGDKYTTGFGFLEIGSIYQIQNNYPEALRYYYLALHTLQRLNVPESVCYCYRAIGETYKIQKNYSEALKNFILALNESKKEPWRTDTNYGDVPTCIDIGEIYQLQGNYKEAQKYYTLTLIGNPAPDFLSSSYIGLGTLNISLNNFQAAKDYLTKGLSISKEIGAGDKISTCYQKMAEADALTNNYKQAYNNHVLYSNVKDSLKDLAGIDKITQMQMKYDFSRQQDSTKAEQGKKDALALAEIKRQKLIKNATLGGVGIAGIFSFLLVLSYNHRRRTIFDKQVSEVEMKALRSQMNPHFIFNSLHSINKYVMDNDKMHASDYLTSFAKLMRLILENSREQEVPLEKDLSSLELYMQLESLRFENKFQYSIHVDQEINQEITMVPPMMMQPFVENSIIHGVRSKENGMIQIRVDREANMIRCTVEDNGIGRDQSVLVETGEKKKRESLGMKITKERLNIIHKLKKVKASVNIIDLKDAENKPSGLRVELLLPFEEAF